MAQNAFSGHCKRFEKSRGNLKTFLLNFFNSSGSGNPAFSLWTPAFAGVASSIFVFRNSF